MIFVSQSSFIVIDSLSVLADHLNIHNGPSFHSKLLLSFLFAA